MPRNSEPAYRHNKIVADALTSRLVELVTGAGDILQAPFGTLSDLLRAHAAEQPDKLAIAVDGNALSYAGLDMLADRIAAALQRDGVVPGEAVAMVAATSLRYAATFLGALRAGAAPAPMAPSSTPDQLAAMAADSGSRLLFVDAENVAAIDLAASPPALPRVVFDDDRGFAAWLGSARRPTAVATAPDDPFNIIYSSGTTGVPKGIVQSHRMRWAHIVRAAAAGFGDAVTLLATPLYSNTTLVSFLPTLAWGGSVVLMRKFDARRYLELAERWRATHTMLVPVQYRRIMADPDFDRFDLSRFRFKTCTSAPFDAALKADVIRRWPGKLVEYYGMTEGGGTCILVADEFPDKLHTVGRPAPGHDIRLIDDDGNEVAPGETGEVVGRSEAMMNGYHRRDRATADALWHDRDGNAFIRHGDVGRFDADGFLILMDRKKDMIISGGFNIYPSDIEAVIATHPDVAEAAVVGVPSETWGETPVAFVVARPGGKLTPKAIIAWTNARVGKTQRIADAKVVPELPRSAIGKVLKRDLRDAYAAAQH